MPEDTLPRVSRQQPSSAVRACLVLAIWLAAQATAVGGDWPQILGPTRSGVAAADEKLAADWPDAGPPLVWQRDVGQGYAGVAVTGDRLFLFHRVDDAEVVECLQAATGDTVWKQAFPSSYAGGIAPDDGPRCVPLCHGEHVFVLGAEGRLICLTQRDGRVLWQRALRTDFAAPEGYFGVGSTPVIAAGNLLVNVGGNGAGIVAIDPASGVTRWQATDERASYSSPVVTRWQGQPVAVFLTRLNLVGIAPGSGEVLFQAPFGKRGPTVNGANPVVGDDSVLLTASYRIGAARLRFARSEMPVVWQLDEGLSSQYTTPIRQGRVVYGIDGRQDGGLCHLRALDWDTGRTLWTQEDFGMATLILADGKLLLLKSNGEAVLVRAAPDAYVELARARLFDTTTRPLPALSGGRLFARDQRTLKCFDLP